MSDTDRGPAVRLVTNSQYNQTMIAVLGSRDNPGSELPTDYLPGSFDTVNANSPFTTTLAEIYYSNGQKQAAAYVERLKNDCALKNFVSSCTGPALVKLAEQAFRRPLSTSERQRWQDLPAKIQSQGLEPREAFSAAITAVFVAPQFLFRSQLGRDNDPPHPELLRMAESFAAFLWNAPPDSSLVDLAKSGHLQDKLVQVAQIERMVSSPATDAMLENFASQWLELAQLEMTSAASSLDKQLVLDMKTESIRLVTAFLKENIAVKNLVDPGFTYLTPALAQHYNLPINGSGPTRVEVKGKNRGGIITSASFLLRTSDPEQPSAVRRGKWILENVLCSPPEPPPNNVANQFPSSAADLPPRQRLSVHRTAPECAGCHILMDPLGLGLENYDAQGRWRSSDRFGLIDASGVLPPNQSFTNPQELVQLLKANSSLNQCVVTKFATYALGRLPNQAERCVIDKIAKRSLDTDYGLRDAVRDIALSLLTK